MRKTILFRKRTNEAGMPVSAFPQSPESSQFPGRMASLGFAITLILTLTACASGEYRLPYTDDTNVTITANHNTHSDPPGNFYDMTDDEPPGFVAAAAAGWVRFIEDSHSETGQGKPNNYVWIEHPYPYCQDPQDPQRATWPGKSQDYDQTCTPCNKAYCNEWTFYYHFQTGSVTDAHVFGADLNEDDWVEAGQYLGMEGDVGHAFGVHLHWHVAVIDPSITPDAVTGYYQDWLDQSGLSDPELIPLLVCHANGKGLLFANGSYTVGPCP